MVAAATNICRRIMSLMPIRTLLKQPRSRGTRVFATSATKRKKSTPTKDTVQLPPVRLLKALPRKEPGKVKEEQGKANLGSPSPVVLEE